MIHSRRSAICCLGFFCSLAIADEPQSLEEIIVTGKAENLLKQAATSSEGYADFKEIANRPLTRRSEILEIVPGMVTTQHAGGGKATQYLSLIHI